MLGTLMLRTKKSGFKFPNQGLHQSTLAGLLLMAASAMTTVACEAPASREDLNPAGPPMVRQVMLSEQVTTAEASFIKEGQLAFGTHAASFFANDDGEVLTAVTYGSQEIRIVLDELIRGNTLEEMACADGSFSRIPNGTTPDDIARCAGPIDSLLDCDTVCLDSSGTPLGVLDADEDLAADQMRMIDYDGDPSDDSVELGVSITCDGVSIPLDPVASFWTPSGNQTFPSNPALTFRGLGPAIVLTPVGTVGVRSGADCSVTFRPEVVDYDDNPICAPEGGDIGNDCSGGDTSRIAFSTETLKFENSLPLDMATDVALGASGFIFVTFNTNIDIASVGALSLTAGGVDVPISPEIGADKRLVSFALAADFEPDTVYELTVSTALTDLLGGPLAVEKVVTWTTGSAIPVPFALDTSVPADNATDVAIAGGMITLNFNTAVDATTVVAAMSLTAATVDVPITPVVQADPTVVVIDLGADFVVATDYVLTITTGLMDVDAEALAANVLINWTTAN